MKYNALPFPWARSYLTLSKACKLRKLLNHVAYFGKICYPWRMSEFIRDISANVGFSDWFNYQNLIRQEDVNQKREELFASHGLTTLSIYLSQL